MPAIRSPNPKVSLTLTFDLIFIGGCSIVMDYLCAKFNNFSLSRFGYIVQTESQTHRQNHTQRRMIATVTRLPLACVIINMHQQFCKCN